MIPKILQPMDVIVVDGVWYNPTHPPIMWRGLDSGVHCCTVKNRLGDLWSPEGKGIVDRTLGHYQGRTISVHRYNQYFDADQLLGWCEKTQQASEGYDFRAWLGFATGLKSLANDESRWTCAELPYWAFQGNGHKITPNDESFVYPRMFRFNPLFKEIYRGRI